mgnify:CR=1 FL=1
MKVADLEADGGFRRGGRHRGPKKEVDMHLYGEWQTEEAERPRLLEGGVIPVSEYGKPRFLTLTLTLTLTPTLTLTLTLTANAT